MKKLRIVNIVTFTYPFIGSGIGNVALAQSEHLANKGNNVTLISSNIPTTQESFTYKRIQFLKVTASNFLYKHNIPVPLFFFPKKVRQSIKEADIVHVHDVFYPSSFFAVFFAHIYKKPVYITQHIPYIVYKNPLFNIAQKIIFHTIGEYMLSYASRVFYFNSEVKQLLKKYKEKLVFLPNGVDISLFHPVKNSEKAKLRIKYDIPLDIPVVIFVGRLVPKKGYDLFYQARSKNYLSLFVGGGIVPDSYTDTTSVLFLGEKSPHEMSELYQLSDIFILPSHSEGYPLSVQEAMASSLPVIISDLQCYKDMRLDRRLVTFITPKKQQIQKAIQKILNTPNLKEKMVVYSRKHSLESDTWEKHIAVLLTNYKEGLK